jgi:antitoxin YefM
MLLETVSYSSLRQNLAPILDRIENDREIYNITRKNHGDVVMLSREDYDSMVETLHLLSSPKNAKRLKEALKEADNEEFVEVEL